MTPHCSPRSDDKGLWAEPMKVWRSFPATGNIDLTAQAPANRSARVVPLDQCEFSTRADRRPLGSGAGLSTPLRHRGDMLRVRRWGIEAASRVSSHVLDRVWVREPASVLIRDGVASSLVYYHRPGISPSLRAESARAGPDLTRLMRPRDCLLNLYVPGRSQSSARAQLLQAYPLLRSVAGSLPYPPYWALSDVTATPPGTASGIRLGFVNDLADLLRMPCSSHAGDGFGALLSAEIDSSTS